MTKRHRLLRLFRYPTRTNEDIGREVQDEFAFHLDARGDALEKEGLSRAEARALAESEFGNRRTAAAACVREGQHLESRRTLAMLRGETAADLRQAIRASLGAPGLSVVIIVTLAVAIAGNAAVFTIIDSLLFKSPAFADPSRLVRIYTGESQVSWANLEDIRRRTSVFDAVVAQRAVAPAAQIGESAVYVTGAEVSSNYFTTLAAPAARGRTFLPSDTGTDLVVIKLQIASAF